MSNYVWADTRPGSDLKRTGADPNKVSAEILQVDKIYGGKAPTGSYYEYVKDNPNAEGHKLFEHDDSIAAYKQRLNQEREIKRSLVIIKAEVVERQLEAPIRAFVNINTKNSEGKTIGVYFHIDEVLNDPEKRAKMVARAKRDAESFIKKYKCLEELSAVIENLEKVIEAD